MPQVPSDQTREVGDRGLQSKGEGFSVSSRVVAALLVVAVALAVASYMGQILTRHTDSDFIGNVAEWIDVDSETNLPTWYSTLLMAMAALFCYLVARCGRSAGSTNSRQWYALSVVMLFLSVDEAAQVHEKSTVVLQRFDLSGLSAAFTFAWVIPWTVLVILIGAYFYRFLTQLPRRDRWDIVLAGGVFVGGALGLEFVEGMVLTARGEEDLTYELVATTQELLEMVGIVLFIRAVMNVLGGLGELRIRFPRRSPRTALGRIPASLPDGYARRKRPSVAPTD